MEQKPIVFVGSKEAGAFLFSFQKFASITVDFIGEYDRVEEAAQALLQYPKSIYIIDAMQFLDDSDQIAQVIKTAAVAMNSQAIIVAPGHSERTTLVQECLEQGIRYFLYGMSQGSQIKGLESILRELVDYKGETYGQSRETFVEESHPESIQEQKESLPPTSSVIIPKTSIGVAGCMPRIGVTTQALQIIKYLHYRHQKAVLIEMNQGHYIDAMKQAYAEIELSYNDAAITYQGVFMVPERLMGHMLKEDYDYYVYDYGNVSAPGFNRTSFLEKDVQVIVCGSSPTELPQVLPILTNPLYENVKFIFSYVDKAEKVAILEMMGDRKEETYFASYTPDPFLFTPDMVPVYDKLIPAYPEVTVERPKRNILPRFFKR